MPAAVATAIPAGGELRAGLDPQTRHGIEVHGLSCVDGLLVLALEERVDWHARGVAPCVPQYNATLQRFSMSGKASLMIGILTTVFFAVIGGSFLLSQKTTWGSILLLLALLRATAVLRQWQSMRAPDED